MKKILAILLAVMLCMSCAAFAEGGTAASDSSTLTVGSAALNGDFIYGFGSSAYDNAIKTMVWDFCYTIDSTAGGEYVVDEIVVKNLDITEGEDGSKTYTFTLWDDMKWSDGESITAKDYVASLLWGASPKWVEAGASTNDGLGLLGYKAYNIDGAEYFAGVKLLGDYEFSVTIDPAELPYYYENVYAKVGPIPTHVWCADVEVVSDENGSKFSDVDAVFADMQNVANTERFAPSIACGPYKFISFENGAATLEINPEFKGDQDGDKPTIQYVVHKGVNTDLDVDMVISGDLDLTTGVIEGDKIEAAKASETTALNSYLRNGYGLIAFTCDWGPTADPNVRWALAYLIDRNAVIDYVLGGYGGTVHSAYGMAQWMYQEAGDELEDELVAFNLNIEKANELLDQTEWAFEADGTTPYDASKAAADGSYMRYNANGEMLTINHMGTDGNQVTDIVEMQFGANAPMAGVNFVVTKSDFNALLDNFYYGFQMGEGERTYCSFNLATNFDAAFDPYTQSWHSDKCGTYENSCQLADDELDALIMELRNTEPGDTDSFIDTWLKYEKRWQELLPEIPLYSNQYFDIYGTQLTGVDTTPFKNYEDIICKIHKN